MQHVHRMPILKIYITVLAFTAYITTTAAESRNFNVPFGFSAPINVGGESPYGLGNSLSSYNGIGGFGLSNGFSGYSGSGIGAVSSYPSLHSFSNFNTGYGSGFNNGLFGHSGSGFYPSTGFGGSFYPGSGFFGNSYALHRPSIGGHYGGLHTSGGIGSSFGNGFVLGASGLGSTGFGGLYGSGFGYGAQQPFK